MSFPSPTPPSSQVHRRGLVACRGARGAGPEGGRRRVAAAVLRRHLQRLHRLRRPGRPWKVLKKPVVGDTWRVVIHGK